MKNVHPNTNSGISHQDVYAAFYASTHKFQIVTCWVGLMLNLIWCISDYFILPDYTVPFFIFRMAVSGITAVLLLSTSIHQLRNFQIVFVLACGISIQNAYMWSVMDFTHFQKHAFAYMALFIGVGMLVYWDIKYSIALIIITLLSNTLFYNTHSTLTIQDYSVGGGLLVLTVAVFSGVLVRTRYRLTLNEIKSRLELAQSKSIIELERNVILHQKNEITQSIQYAQRIQSAYMPSPDAFNTVFPNAFLLFKPKDIVSGDFYWFYTPPSHDASNSFVYAAVADCTGHGVPGALMSVICCNALNDAVLNKNCNMPDEILNETRIQVKRSLKSQSYNDQKDGMDVALIKLNRHTGDLWYAGAYNPIWIISHNLCTELQASKQPIGVSEFEKPFHLQHIKLNAGDGVYLFTDGFADQFGGPNQKKYKYKAFRETLCKNSNLPIQQQGIILEQAFEAWKGASEQVDDVLVMGIQF